MPFQCFLGAAVRHYAKTRAKILGFEVEELKSLTKSERRSLARKIERHFKFTELCLGEFGGVYFTDPTQRSRFVHN